MATGGAEIVRHGMVRRVAKRAVPADARDAIRSLLREIRLERTAVRNGVSAGAVLRHRLLRQDDRLVFKGIRVRSPDPAATWLVARDLWSHEEYDVPGFEPRSGWRIADIGANVGLFAMHAASRGATVVAFEPHPSAARCFRANTARWRVELHETAVVGAPTDHVTLWLNPERDIRHTIIGKDVRTGRPLAEGIEVRAVPIDSVLAQPWDLLKLDCEGAEFEILEHGGDALRRTRRIIAEVHLHAGNPAAATGAVRRAGFDVRLRRSEHLGAPYVQLTATRRD